MTEKQNIELVCGTCAWFRRVDIPKDKQPPGFTPRGFCHNQPPTVFPMQEQKKSTLALAQGNQQPEMQMLPMMMRPIVEEGEAMCGQFQPNKATRAQLDVLQAQRKAKGCDPGSCGKEGCDCGD
jgi:hypothetical protein